MIRELPIRHTSSTPAGQAPSMTGVLRRKCGCGSQTKSSGDCEECKKKKLQRKTGATGEAGVAPPIVNEVLRSPGQSLDAETRHFMEPRFGHDFSRVRVHTGYQASESAQAINALAYTVGSSLVFADGQYAPRAASGRKLLAHELAHVVQQQGTAPSEAPQSITAANDASEFAADRMAERVIGGSLPLEPSSRTGAHLMRKLRVDKPALPVPKPPDGQGSTQTNGQLAQEALRTMAQGSEATVDNTSGEVSLATAYCPGFWGGLAQGARSGFRVGNTIGSVGGHVPLLGPIVGLVGGLIGAIGGAFAGLFGNESISAAGASSTPTGSKCLCTIVNSSNWWTIEINDSDHPRTMNESDPRNAAHTRNGRVRVTSPNSPKQYGAATMGGQLENDPTWLILSHELCGHAWLQENNLPEASEERSPQAIRNSQTGKLDVGNRNTLRGSAVAPHGDEFAIQRENLIRQEHHLPSRGYRIRDPYCGESFWRDRADPQGPVHFTEGEDPKFTFMQQCEYLRSELPENKDGKYPIDQQIPEQPEGDRKKEGH